MRLNLSSSPAVAALVFLVAFAVRLIFAFQWNATPYGLTPLMDAADNFRLAQAVAHGQLLQAGAFYLSPLYPYVLGAVYALFGSGLFLASVINAVLDAGTCAILSLVAFGSFGPVAALATGLFGAFNDKMIFYTAPVMKESLGLFLLSAFIWCAFKALDRKKAGAYFGAGVCLGLAELVRGNALFLAPGFLVLILFPALRRASDRKTGLKYSALFLAAFLAPIVPVTIHNAIASRDFVPVNYADGFNFYLGHFEQANGVTYVFPENIANGPASEEDNAARIAAEALGRSLLPSEVSRYWRGKAFEAIGTDPSHEFGLILNKLGALWRSGPGFDLYDKTFVEENFPTLLSAPLPGFWIVAFFAPFGVFAFAAVGRKTVVSLLLFGGFYALSLLFFYVTDRYRLPLLVFLLPLAGAGVVGAWKLLREPPPVRFVFAAILAFASLGLSFWPGPAENLESYNWSMLSKIYVENEQYAEALEAFRKATSIEPRTAGASVYKYGAFALERLGRQDEAESALNKGMLLYPNDASLVYEYGRLKAATGDLDAAETAFEKAIKTYPAYPLAYYSRAMVLMKKGKRAEARNVIEKGLDLAPSFSLLRDACKSMAADKTDLPPENVSGMR